MRKIPPTIMSVLLLFISLFTGQGFAYSTHYTITDLGTNLDPKAINNAGQVVGTLTDVNGYKQAFLYTNGTVKALGMFGFESWGLGINDAGTVVGKFASFSGVSHAFVSQNGQFTDLFGATGMNAATGINNAGEIIGTITLSPRPYIRYVHTILYNNGGIIDISNIAESLGLVDISSDSIPNGLNNAGQAIIFQSLCASYECDLSALFSGGTVIGYPGGFDAYDINDHGEVIGTSELFLHVDCYLYGSGGATTLSDFGGGYCVPRAINNLGQIVGTASDPDRYLHSFVYNKAPMSDLQELIPANSGWEIQGVYDINDRGQIIGTGTISGETHAFILTPDVQLVNIDIKPDNESNIVNLRSNGVISIAILGSSVFDATKVNPATVNVGGAVLESMAESKGKRDKHFFHLKDVNGDGFMDLVCKVEVSQIYVEPNASSALITLEAETLGGQKIYGEDSIQVVPSR